MPTKSDRSDARGIAQAVRTGWFRAVHAKSALARQIRALLAARRLIVSKRADIEAGLRGLLRGFGLKVGKTTPARFGARVLALAADTPIEAMVRALVEVHAVMRTQELAFDRQVYALAKADPVSRLLASAPGVGAIVALTFRAAVDDPHRFRRARQAGAQFGLIPRRYQSGEIDRMGGISRAGDASVRAALYEAATAILGRLKRNDPLALWAHRLAARRGLKRARVALARKLAVVLLAMWKTQTCYRTSAA
jgi:transposase